MGKRVLAFAMIVCLLLAGCRATAVADELEIYMLDVGDADCFVLRQGTEVMLIDAGYAVSADKIVSTIAALGINRLDYVLLSHPHGDHIGSMERILSAFDIGVFLYAAVPEDLLDKTLLHARVEEVIITRSIKTRDVTKGICFDLGEALVEVYPLSASFDDVNDFSAVCRVTYEEQRMLFTGDMGEAAQAALLASGADIAADVVKVPHHGGTDALSEAFLQAVSPRYALISCGMDSGSAHPAPKTIELLQSTAVGTYRTDLHGDVAVRISDEGIAFETS